MTIDHNPIASPGDYLEVTDISLILVKDELGASIHSGAFPQCVFNRSPQVARLFPDYEAAERTYYQHTGIFPIMHTVVIRKELLAHPGLAQSIYRGFCASKEVAMEQYRKGALKQHMALMIPWFSQLFDENRRLFPDDWWTYGVEANRKAINTFLRYHFEQGLSQRRLRCEDIFFPELLGT
ncbi:MAG: hypothetical protein PUP91_20435 [Rhizonema sp. PD37]|nr:hypothetical protein [Rhizonema sp. PD37]